MVKRARFRRLALGATLTITLTLAACSGGDTGSLQGLLAFTPNAVLVFVRSLPDGGVDTRITDIEFTRSSPEWTCADYGGQFPASGLFYDVLEIKLDSHVQIPAGTYPIDSIGGGCLGQFCNLLGLYGATDPPSSMPFGLAAGVSGSITLTKVGAEYAGNFTSTVAFEDGGQSMLSGSFDTSTVCVRPGF